MPDFRLCHVIHPRLALGFAATAAAHTHRIREMLSLITAAAALQSPQSLNRRAVIGGTAAAALTGLPTASR